MTPRLKEPKFQISFPILNRDTLDSVKQSAALCLLKLIRNNPDIMPTGEWTTRIIHLLNDQHLVIKIFFDSKNRTKEEEKSLTIKFS